MQSPIDFFKEMTDPRVERCRRHNLSDIIFITIASVICGAETWEDIEEYGKTKEEWLKSILELPNGIPSHDTFNRVYAALDPAEFEQCFSQWIKAVAVESAGRIVSIDGKRLCGSGEHGSKSIVHMVSAWCNENSLVLGQIKVDDKSNEITAIPNLLDILAITDCTVTIDAMGCQTAIAEKIVSKEADYILAVKGNQEHLYDDIKEAFSQNEIISIDVQLETGHGRIEKRSCRTITNTDWICKKEQWEKLQTIIAIDTQRTNKKDGTMQTQTRYYISSHRKDAAFFNQAIRAHWGIENKLHWALDVSFGEDASQKRAGYAAQNFSLINKIALNLTKNYEDKKGAKRVSVKTKRLKSGWDNDYLLNILTHPLNTL